MKKAIGVELTKAFKYRYDQIKAFPNFADFISTRIDRTESLVGDMKGYYSMTLNANFRIIISPNTDDTSIENLKTIDTFKIIGVIDYHGTGKKNNKWLIK